MTHSRTVKKQQTDVSYQNVKIACIDLKKNEDVK